MRFDLITKYFSAMHEKITAAVVGAIMALAAGFAGLEKPYQLAALLLTLVFIDTITGILAAMRQERPIHSHLVRRIVEKLVAYYSVILILLIALYSLGAPTGIIRWAALIVTGALIGIEGLSIIENIAKLKIRRLGPILTAISRVMRWPIKEFTDQVDKLQPKEQPGRDENSH
jgi:phage-related holin